MILICKLILIVIIFIVGVYVGRISITTRMNHAGIFHINTKDLDKDIIQIELKMAVGELIEEKEIVFEVRKDS